MAARIVLSPTQNRVKDCYVPIPILDMTLRCNGEEKVMVMDSLGNWTEAGFIPPSVAPTVTTTGSAGSFTANKYWAYKYVLVAKNAYPLIQNAVSGGGSFAPRSNPSPLATANSTVNTNQKSITIPTSTRADISHMWLYRTGYFSTAQEATDAANAGVAFWIGEVINDPNLATVPFTDAGTLVGQEQLENDNFPAPQFRYAVFHDPYVWGFGNDEFVDEVTITSTGLVTLTGATDLWFNGRDTQRVTLDGITTGGYDNHGNFYFKWLSNTTGQLYQDIALTLPIGSNYTGTTNIHIKGASTTLYRCKPKNIHSWGTTEEVGDLAIPSLYFFTVSGGIGTGIAIVPNQNLLKLDTQSPNKCFTLNLKNAGNINFEQSLRIISDSSTSSHHSQFIATIANNRKVVWSLDTKTFSILESDGTSQEPISNNVYRTLRSISVSPTDREFLHGVYSSKLELNCIFLRTTNSISNLNTCIYYHGPTKQWGILEVYDVLCAEEFFHPQTKEAMVFVGTATGFIGEMFTNDWYWHWYTPTAGDLEITSTLDVDATINRVKLGQFNANDIAANIGVWCRVEKYGVSQTEVYNCRISDINGAFITFDLVYRENILQNFPGIGIGTTGSIFIGVIHSYLGKFLTAQLPFDYKKVDDIWISFDAPSIDSDFEIDFSGNLKFQKLDYYRPDFTFYESILQRNLTEFANDGTGTSITGIQQIARLNKPAEILLNHKHFGFLISDLQYVPVKYYAYQLNFTTDGNNST